MIISLIILAAAAAVAAMLSAPVITRAAKAAGIVDMPGPRKVHKRAIPRLGGVVVVAVLIAALCGAALLGLTEGASVSLYVLVGASLVIFLVGLVDDVAGLGPGTKFLAQLLCATAVCICGTRVETISLAPGTSIHLGMLSIPATIGWILLGTNAVNFIDGLDGLAGGICAMAAGALAVCAMAAGQTALALLMLTVLGCLLGFLVFNVHPASIFLGDCGSMFLGFLLASASAFATAQSGDGRALAITGLALGVPILDALLSIVRRATQRHSIYLPDRGHVHHQLLAMGDSHVQAVTKMLAITGVITAVAMSMLLVGADLAWAVALSDAAILLAAMGYILRSSLGETWRHLGASIDIAWQKRAYTRTYEDSLNILRESTCFDEWWRAVSQAAERIGLNQISMVTQGRNHLQRRFLWMRSERILSRGILHLTVSVLHRRSGLPLDLAIEIPITATAELAGYQASVFGRLIGEFSLADLPAQAAGIQPAIAQAGAA